MKREYKKPIAKYVDFEYEEQIVATSNSCIQYNLWSLDLPTPTQCQDNLRDIKYQRMYSDCVWNLVE